MRVETYSDRYFLDVVKLVEKFYSEYLTDYYGAPLKEVITETINSFKDSTFLLIDGDKCVGVLAGVEIKSKLNDQKFFQEIMWYVDKPFGRYAFYLIKQAKIMLKSTGFSNIIMSVIENEKVSKIENIYKRMKLRKLETHYLGEL